MTWLANILLVLAGLFGGGLVVGIVVVPCATRRAYERGLEARRVIDGVAELRETQPWPRPLTARDTDTTTDLPVQLGTLPEHQRRLPLRFGEVTDETLVEVSGEPEEDWPRSWRLLWPVLLFAAHFWWTPAGVRVDRTVVASWAFLGRYEPRWFYDEPAPRHAAARDLDGEAERRRLALLEPTQELPIVEPGRELVGVGAP